MFNDSINFGE